MLNRNSPSQAFDEWFISKYGSVIRKHWFSQGATKGYASRSYVPPLPSLLCPLVQVVLGHLQTEARGGVLPLTVCILCEHPPSAANRGYLPHGRNCLTHSAAIILYTDNSNQSAFFNSRFHSLFKDIISDVKSAFPSPLPLLGLVNQFIVKSNAEIKFSIISKWIW